MGGGGGGGGGFVWGGGGWWGGGGGGVFVGVGLGLWFGRMSHLRRRGASATLFKEAKISV